MNRTERNPPGRQAGVAFQVDEPVEGLMDTALLLAPASNDHHGSVR